MEFALGQAREVSQYLLNVKLTFAEIETIIPLHIVPLPSYDVILGLDWLFKVKAKVDSENHYVLVKASDGKTIKLNSSRKPFENSFLSAM